MTSFLQLVFLIANKVVSWQHWTWLVPHETAAILVLSVFTIPQCIVSLHANLHMEGACMFSCNLLPALLAEWPGSFLCTTAVIRGWNKYQNIYPGEDSPAAPAGTQTHNLSITSLALTTELSPLPNQANVAMCISVCSVALSLMMTFSGCVGCKHYLFFYVARSRAYYFMPAPDTQATDSLAVFQYYEIRCNGDESTLSQCPLQYTSSGCSHDRDVGISCNTGWFSKSKVI